MPQSLIGLRFFHKFLPENIERKDVKDDKRNSKAMLSGNPSIRELRNTRQKGEDRV